MEGNCKTCGTRVWAGSEPRHTELVICPRCFSDCSTPATDQQRAQDWRRRVYRRMECYGETFDVAAAVVPYGLDRERSYDAEVARMKERAAIETTQLEVAHA